MEDARILLRSLVLAKQYDLWLRMFQKCQNQYPQLGTHRDILEDFAQQVLEDGMHHPSTTVRVITVLAIGLARDFRLTPLVSAALRDDHEIVRQLALQVALQYGTEPLKQQISTLAREDDSMQVRLVAYQVGTLLEIEGMQSLLQKHSQDFYIDGVERREAWKASSELSFSGIEALQSQGEWERIYALCEALRTEPAYCNSETFLKLLTVSDPEIQEHVLLTVSMYCQKEEFRYEPLIAHIRSLATSSPFTKVRLKAAAILHLLQESDGTTILVEGLQSPFVSVCEAASEAVCCLGIQGAGFAKQYLTSLSSKKAALNLSVLLLVCREDIERAGDIVATFIPNPEICWSIDHFLLDARFNTQGMQTSSLYVHMIKREIGRRLIRLLALSKYSRVKQIFAEFLANDHQQGWSFFSGVFGEECDESVLEPTQNSSQHFAVQLEAVLTALNQKRDDVSVQKAIQMYASSRWQDKLSILESLAFSENTSAVPFLIQQSFQEPPSLRSAMAGVLFALFK